jgi:putative ABC transport system permease protein
MTSVLASISVALETLRLNPLRTALSTLGIIMGAASLAAVLSLADGGERLARQQIEREGLQIVQLRPQTETRVDGIRVPQLGYPLFTDTDTTRLAADLGPASAIQLTMEGTGTIDAPGQRTRAVRIVGRFEANHGHDSTPVIAEGRMLSETEMRDAAATAVIGTRLSNELKAASLPGGRVGETLTVGGQPLKVIGVLAPTPGEQVFTVIAPFGIAETAMVPSRDPRPRTISIRVDAVENVKDARALVERFAAAQPGWAGRYTVASYGLERLEQLSRGILVFKMLMGAFTAISLLVGGIGIMNVLLASILERTREIGVRKAVGARRRDVLLQFLVESTTISAAGTAAGVTLGVAGAFVVTAIIRARTEAPLYAAITWQTLVVTTVAAVSIGLAAGLYPALRASRLTTIDAIQRE